MNFKIFNIAVDHPNGGPGMSPPGKFRNLRRNLVQPGAFWQEIYVSPAFHLCERIHCHSGRQWY